MILLWSAIFGIGLNRPADEWVKALFQHFRASKAFTLSIDISSGLYPDKIPDDENGVVWSNYVLSFQSPKLVFFLPDTGKYIAQWDVLDIGFDEEYLSALNTEVDLIGKHEVLPLYKTRSKFSHKGDFGHSLIIGGSFGKIGAVILASRAALSIGSGLVTAFVPKCGYTALQSAVPEAMVITNSNAEIITAIDHNIVPSAIAIGIGIGLQVETIAAFEAFLKQNKSPLVIDADGINILSKRKALLKLLPEHCVLTPHPKELERLVGKWTDDFDKLEKTKTLSSDHNIIIIIKGANSMIVYKDHLYINSTGNPGMATAGSGDVLTGIICGLISQGYAPLDATIFGTYLHGRSGDIAAMDYGYESLIAGHLIEYLGEAFKDLFKPPETTSAEEKNDPEGEEMYI